MAGPVASLLMPAMVNTLSLESLGPTGLSASQASITVQITDTRGIGGDYFGEGRPFLLWLQEPDLDGAEKARIIDAFGFAPLQEFVLAAMCNAHEDHRILGALTLHFAKEISGIVDFGGALVPPQWRNREYWKASWCEVEEEFNLWAVSFPGTIISLPYTTADGRTWARHLADAKFLADWLRHQDFSMVK